MLLKKICGRLDPINTSPSELAIEGFDPVAYFTEGKAVMGYSEFRHVWMGAIWQFSNDRYREMFVKHPVNYSPQYGGYCAYGISLGKIFGGDPRLWTIVEGKLYLNLNHEVAEIWTQDIQSYIDKADIQWPKLKV